MTVEEAIDQVASKKRKFQTSDVLEALEGGVSRQYVSSALSRRVSEGRLIREGLGRASSYALPRNAAYLGHRVSRRFRNQELKEHEALADVQKNAPFMEDLSDNVSSILAYAFSEMMNNAIEHSKSENIQVVVSDLDGRLHFTVRDWGVGVFRNVMEDRNLQSELEAIQDLLKGKTTTQPQAHSGEGIFFTSKIADEFILDSYGYQLRVDNTIPDVFVERTRRLLVGTRVTFKISARTHKHLSDVFKRYQTDPEDRAAFDKTEIQIKLYTMGTIHVSRSQARRVLAGLEKFRSIILDFDRVPTIGQAFADEIFRVFKQAHPEIQITPTNTNEAVQFMIDRVGSA